MNTEHRNIEPLTPKSSDPDHLENLVPEADGLDQATPVDPSMDPSPLLDERTDWADDADQLEQRSTLAHPDEEDYPPRVGDDEL